MQLEAVSSNWFLDRTVTFLNHGSYGACPIPVLEYQQQLRQRLERQPAKFFNQDYEPLLDQARQELAEFVGADPADLVFIPNATTGVNTVLRSLCSSDTGSPFLQAGDEVLVTNQEYNACCNALDFIAIHFGIGVKVAVSPYPLSLNRQTAEDQMIESILSQVTSRTRLALLDYVTSQTALIFPIARLVDALRDRGIATLIDAAHAPGMVPLNLKTLGATYVTGNCHKWLCSPKGAAFLYVQNAAQSRIRPLTISHGANSTRCDRTRWQLEFDWTGTHDPTAFLAVPSAIRFMGSLLPGGWPELMAHNHATAIAARQLLCDQLEIAPPYPTTMLGSMATIPLPNGSDTQLHDALLQQFQIEVPIIPWPAATMRLLRISAQIYNTIEHYQALSKALLTLLE
jgi:isopenicillin-N epimerase